MKAPIQEPHNLPLPLPSQTYHLPCTLLSASLSSLFPWSRWPLLKVFVLVWLHSQWVNSWNVTLVLLFPLKAGSCCLLWSQSHIHTSGPAPSGVTGQGSFLVWLVSCLTQSAWHKDLLGGGWGQGLAWLFRVASGTGHMARAQKCVGRNFTSKRKVLYTINENRAVKRIW